MGTDSWIEDEPGVGAAARQVGRTLRRGVRLPLVAVGAGVVLALAVVGVVALAQAPYEPSFVLRVVETDRDPASMPHPRRQLRQYVLDAAFTGPELLRIIEKRNLYPALAHRSMRAALESFREDIDVEVYRNYFVEQRSAHEAPRSARVVVRYRSDDPALALAVTRDLGELVMARERAERSRVAAQAARLAKRALDRLDAKATSLRLQIAEKRVEIADEPGADPQREVELVGLLGSLEDLQKQVASAQRTNAELELGADYERSGAGLRFEIVDDGSVARSDRLQPPELAGIGLLSLILALPLAVLTIGAFAPEGGRL